MNIAINGFGRIGRAFFRQAFGHEDINFVAINDLADVENLAYLLRYDTVYGRYEKSVEVAEGKLIIDGRDVKVMSEPAPEKLPWGGLGVDVVIESTGVFTRPKDAARHLEAGAKRVIISAKAKEDEKGEINHVTPGVIEERLEEIEKFKITSDTSCTTNSVVPVLSVLSKNPGIKKALLSTVHGYTATQSLVDGPNKDWRRGRAAAQNIIPTTTSAAVAAAKVIPGFKDTFDGISLRVPVISGSISDFTFVSDKKTSVEEINNVLKEASQSEQWKDILRVTDEPLVSSDIVGTQAASIVDLSFTRVVDGDLVKVLVWYDNEWGYAYTLLRHALSLKSLL